MKKIVCLLMLCLNTGYCAFAESADKADTYNPVDSKIFLISAAVLLVGIIAVSAFNGFAYNKKNLRSLMSQYRANRSNSRSNYGKNRGTYNNSHYMHQQMQDEFNRQAMEESIKAVTPFDHGGYVQGAGFNPSDTAAQQMNDMNNNNMGMF